MESSGAAAGMVAVLKVVDVSLPIVADMVRLINALASRHGVDVTIEIRDLETDAIKTINETEKILEDVSGVK